MQSVHFPMRCLSAVLSVSPSGTIPRLEAAAEMLVSEVPKRIIAAAVDREYAPLCTDVDVILMKERGLSPNGNCKSVRVGWRHAQ